ncbi:MAG TPA: alpha/beta fold hydrolase [Gemmatimonadaceae bacterium]|nr:alpha/beta fold hydrolase [Gemmatimonadaceae bacterium]
MVKVQLPANWRKILAVALLVLILPFAARAIAYRTVERNGLISRPVGPETPATFGVPYARAIVPRGSYQLDGVFTKFSDRAPLVVIFHGSAESVSYWADVQALLYKQGISSYVFDYSGFGNSGGERRATVIAEDVRQAWRDAAIRFPYAQRRIALAYSLGSGFLVSEFPALVPDPQGLALVASYSSAREAAVAFGTIPGWAATVLPDLWNTVENIEKVKAPVLIVHSDTDQLFPISMPRRIFRAANEPKAFIRLQGYTHEDGHVKPDGTYWAGVMTFAQTGKLPQTSY